MNHYSISVKPYSPDDKIYWDSFVDTSKNGTFLVSRDYMDYHADRFPDSSFIFYKREKIIALFPATIHGDELSSHQGLTYGGLVMDRKITADETLEIFRLLILKSKELGINHIIYKAIPHIYHRLPSEEDLYALFVWNAHLIERKISSTILLEERLKFRDIRKYGIRKALKENIIIEETQDIAEFWQILTKNLNTKYHCNPVHSLAEMELLKSRFPANIRVFIARSAERVQSGVVIYETPTVAHVQYISASEEGKASGSLDLIFSTLINDVFKDKKYFDFGTSTEDGGYRLNEQLIYQKEGFGARGICYDTYKLIIPGSF